MQQKKLIQSRKYSPENLGDVCVLGLGSTGLAVANYFISQMPNRVDSCHVYAGEKTEFAMKTADKLLSQGVTVSFDDKTIDTHYDLCVVSPGISNLSDLYKTANSSCDELISEIELAWRESDKSTKWVAVTGTNGKTTTTSLITHILTNCGKKSVAVGNIGNVAIKQVSGDRLRSVYEHNDIYVVEVSSYQLSSCICFAPDIAILLNVTPDHIKWHGTFEAYCQSKLSIFDRCSTSIININDEVTMQNIERIHSNTSINDVIEIGDIEEHIDIVYKGNSYEICSTSDLKIIGKHNYINAQAASAASLVLGCNVNQISNALCSFSPLEHRLEMCGIVAGCKCFNDSKATNVDAVMVALNSFEPNKAIFLMGGRDKGTDLTELVIASINKIKGVICFGECRDRFYSAFLRELQDDNSKIDINKKQTFVLKRVENMQNAFEEATKISYPGDSIVLSPACASFDEFENFEKRGIAFKELVKNFGSNQ